MEAAGDALGHKIWGRIGSNALLIHQFTGHKGRTRPGADKSGNIYLLDKDRATSLIEISGM